MTTGRTLGGIAARGGRDLAFAQVFRIALQLSGVVVLSRLLTPSELGMMAVAVAIVGFGEVIRDFGLTTATTREPSLTESTRDLFFWLNCAIAVIAGALLFLLAPVISGLFDMAELSPILRTLAIVFLVNGLGAQYRADCSRRLRFRALAVVEVVGQASGLVVAVLLAFGGYGAWAVVWQLVVAATIISGGFALIGRWLPRRPGGFSQARGMLRFGRHVAVSQALAYFGTNVDTLVLGSTSTAAVVGSYNRAFQLGVAPFAQVRAPFQTVAVPVLSRLRDDSAKYQRALLAAQGALGYLLAPIAGLLIGAPGAVLITVLGPGWGHAAPVLAALAVAGVLQLVASVANWIFIVGGFGSALQRFSAISMAVKVALVVLLAVHGALGVAIGYAVAVAAMWPVALLWALKLAKLDRRPLVGQSLRIVGSAALCAGGSFGCSELLTAAGVGAFPVFLGAAGASILGLATAFAFSGSRKDMIVALGFLRMAASSGSRD